MRKPGLETLRSLVSLCAEHGEGLCVLALRKDDADRWSCERMADHVRRVTNGLIDAGVGKGDRIAIIAPNSPRWIAACLGVINAGAVVVPLDVQFSDELRTHALTDSGARYIFTTSAEADGLEKLDLDDKPRIVLLDAGDDDERSWQRLLREDPADLPEISSDDNAVLFYTSGTTGAPKGVPLTHGNLSFQIDALLEAGLVTSEDRGLLPLPLHHVYPFTVGMLIPIAIGMPIVLPHALTGPQITRALREGRITAVIGVPRLYRALYSGIEARLASQGMIVGGIVRGLIGLCTFLRRRLGLRLGKVLLRPIHKQFGEHLRVLASGGSPIDPDLAWKLEGLGWQITIGYGLTETSPLLTIMPPGEGRMDTVGQPIPGIEMRLDTSAPTAESGEEERAEDGDGREKGEVLARGPAVFHGYHNLPDKTKESLTEDGWFRTGDLGYFDDDGYVHLLGRASTLIVTEGGKNVEPTDVEEAYERSPVLREVGVLEEEGRLVAAIVPDPGEARRQGGAGGSHGGGGSEGTGGGSSGDGDQLQAAVRKAVEEQARRLPSYQRISDYVTTRDPLPRTRLGKLQRHKLGERYEEARRGEEKPTEVGPMDPERMSQEDRSLLENDAAAHVWDDLAEKFPDERLTPDTSPQLDLGIDSLEWLNLTLDIRQRVGVELTEEAIGRIETVRDLLREVAEASEAEGGAAGPTRPPLEDPEAALDERQKRWLRPLGPVALFASRVMFGLNRLLCGALFRVRATGVEHVPERDPFIIAPNHLSYLDPFAIAAVLGQGRLRRIYWGGWTGTAFANPVTRLVSRLARVVPVDPRRAAMSSLAFGGAVLKSGRGLVWFPEGRRSTTGDVGPFRPGIGMLLHHFDAPVVPVLIEGADRAMPPGRALPRLHRITLTFGEPLDPKRLEEEGEGDEPHERIANALREHVARLKERAD